MSRAIAAADHAGNDRTAPLGGPNPASFTLVVDRTPPTVDFRLDPSDDLVDCDGIYHEPLTITVTIADPYPAPATYVVRLDGEPVAGWEDGIELPASGDFTLEVEAEDLAGNAVLAPCGPVRIQLFELSTWVDGEFPRVLLFNNSGSPATYVKGILDDAGVYYVEVTTTVAAFTEEFRTGAYDIAFLHRGAATGSPIFDEVRSQVWKGEGLLMIKLDATATASLAPALGVTYYGVDPTWPGDMMTNPSPLTGDESFAATGTTVNLLPGGSGQISLRHEQPGKGVPATTCQGLASIDYRMASPVTPTSVTVEVSDLLGVVDVETSPPTASPVDLSAGNRANVVLLWVDASSAGFRIVTPDGYRIEPAYDVTVTVTRDGGPPVVYAATLPSTCTTPLGPAVPPFLVEAKSTIDLFGIDPSHPPAFVGALHRFGFGGAVFLGFDLALVPSSRVEQLLVDAVEYVKSRRGCPRLGKEIVAVKIAVNNDSPFAAEVELTTALPAGSALWESVDEAWSESPLTYRLALAAQPSPDAEQTVTYLLRLPAEAGTYGGTTTLGSLDDGISYTEVSDAEFDCEVLRNRIDQAEYVVDVLEDLMGAVAPSEWSLVASAIAKVEEAISLGATTRTPLKNDIVMRLVPALANVEAVTTANPTVARVELGHVIRLWEIAWYEAP